MLFGQFVGVWDFDGVEYHSDGTRPTDKGEIHFAWVLQGRAIQDVWTERERTDKNALVYGTTVRFYDPNIDAWRAPWMDPVNGVVSILIGRKVADEIIIEGKAADGAPTRWIFSEIKSLARREIGRQYLANIRGIIRAPQKMKDLLSWRLAEGAEVIISESLKIPISGQLSSALTGVPPSATVYALLCF